MKRTHFERAIFISWYCSKRDCAFCYLSSRRHVNPDPVKDRRSYASIFAEAIICKACGWKVEFLSGGCDSYSDDELLFVIKNVYQITKQKQWLNIGVLNEKQMERFKQYTEGVCGTVECITPGLRDRLCPSKPLSEIEYMFKKADKLGLKKAVTIVLGIGESTSDIGRLKEFLREYNVDRITLYRLKGQKGTVFEGKDGPKTEDYVVWVKELRKAFPDLDIIVGSWLSHFDELHLLLEAGADAITKFPSIRGFDNKYAKKIEEEAKIAGKKFEGTLTKAPIIKVDEYLKDLDLSDELKTDIKKKLREYVSKMTR